MNQNSSQLYQTTLTKKTQQGFTLIELLVVILILGILSAVALPSLLNQVGKARETEAKQNLSAFSTAQQAYFFENAQFATTPNDLQISVSNKFYNYQINTADLPTQVIHEANAINAINQNIRDYAIGIYYQNQSFGTVLCQSNKPGDNALPSTSTLGDCDQGKEIR